MSKIQSGSFPLKITESRTLHKPEIQDDKATNVFLTCVSKYISLIKYIRGKKSEK